MVSALRSLCGGAVHLVGRMRMGGDRFEHAGRKYNAAQMVARYSREATVCKKYRCTHFSRNVRLGGVDVRLHFLRMGRCRTWSVIATTDTGLRFSEVFETYQIRWNIETLFKECRQYLGLGGWQGTDFCGQVADCTLCLMTHTVLTLAKRFSEYETLGELFREEREGLLAVTQWKRTLDILERLLTALSEVIDINLFETVRLLASGTSAGAELAKALTLMGRLVGDGRAA